MKLTMNFYDFRGMFETSERSKQFSNTALVWIWDYFEDYEESTGEEIEFDLVGICCEYVEMTWDEVAKSYVIDDISDIEDEDEKREFMLEYFSDRTTVVGHDDGLVVFQNF